MNYLMTLLLSVALTGAGVSFTSLALADHYGGHGMHNKDHHMEHGKHHGHHSHHGGDYWKNSLTDEQRTKVDKLKEDYYKKKHAIKTKIKDTKATLAKVITNDSPKQKDIDKNIDAILKLKREKMQLKVAHKIEVRKLLTTEQKVKFDEYILNKGTYCKYQKGHR